MTAEIIHLRARMNTPLGSGHALGIGAGFTIPEDARTSPALKEILARESAIMRETRDDLSLLAKTLRTLSETFAMGRP